MRRDTIFERDILRADNFLRGHREKSPSFHGGVVHDQHDHAAMHPSESGDDTRRGSASPFLVHLVRRVESEFEERTGIGEEIDALAAR